MLEQITQLDPILLMAGGAMVASIFIAVVFLTNSVLGARARFERRLVTVAGETGPFFGKDRAAARTPGAPRRRDIEAKLKEAETLKQKKSGYRLREQLIQAGLSISPQRFYLYSAISAVVFTGLVLAIGVPYQVSPIGLIVGGLGIPRYILGKLVQRRIAKFIAQFPDAIDMIVRGVRTGMTVGESLIIVSREVTDPLGGEFRQITEGIQLGLTMEECLNKLTLHVPTTEVRFFAIVLVTQQTTGGNLAETLAKLSEILRQRKKMKDKIQALSSEAKASAGIIGALPVAVSLLLSLVAPNYIALLFTTDPGNWILLIGLCTMATGVFVMKQMINFDF